MMVKKEQIKSIIDALAGGCSVTDACAIGRVSREWFYEKLRNDPKMQERVDYAQAVCKQRNIARVQNASKEPKHWTAAAWWLERRFPEEYAETKKHDVREEGTLADLLAAAFTGGKGSRSRRKGGR